MKEKECCKFNMHNKDEKKRKSKITTIVCVSVYALTHIYIFTHTILF